MIVTKHFQEMKIFVIVNKHLMEGHPEHIGNFKAIKKIRENRIKIDFPFIAWIIVITLAATFLPTPA